MAGKPAVRIFVCFSATVYTLSETYCPWLPFGCAWLHDSFLLPMQFCHRAIHVFVVTLSVHVAIFCNLLCINDFNFLLKIRFAIFTGVNVYSCWVYMQYMPSDDFDPPTHHSLIVRRFTNLSSQSLLSPPDMCC